MHLHLHWCLHHFIVHLGHGIHTKDLCGLFFRLAFLNVSHGLGSNISLCRFLSHLMGHTFGLELLLTILNLHKIIHFISLIEVLLTDCLIAKVVILPSHHTVDILGVSLSKSCVAFLSESRLLLDSVCTDNFVISFFLQFFSLVGYCHEFRDYPDALGAIEGIVSDLGLEWERVDL